MAKNLYQFLFHNGAADPVKVVVVLAYSLEDAIKLFRSKYEDVNLDEDPIKIKSDIDGIIE